ncbi:MAG: TlpA family protein disulfide reductase [Desulfomonile tiedjei]|uniref:TlpA family protein disulfide reductase n=1 Tax=Desulfomonile tiedjei TaxID=2358 RepID=A0A9D6Z5L2_9BACT|nr:TlpA family protein disulfide reductase [Desulfomonile tiedjei]
MQPRVVEKILLVTAFLVFTFANIPAAAGSDLSKSANIFVLPKPFPVADLVLKSASGQTVSLKDFKGKVVLLHFWSINCPACKVEEPLLQQLKKAFGASGLEILGVNLVDSPQEIMGHAAAHATPFPVLFDGGKGFNLKVVDIGGRNTAFLVNPLQEAILEVPGFPTTYILDCRGSVIGYSVGAARWNNQDALKFIQSLLADSKSCVLGGKLSMATER